VRGLVFAALLCGCDSSLSEMDNIYTRGADHAVMCGFSLDNKEVVSADSIAAGLARAQVDGTVIHLYAHETFARAEESTLELLFSGAADRHLPFVTYRDLAEETKTTGLAFSFDGHNLTNWYSLRSLFDRYGAKVTFFISSFSALTLAEFHMLVDLANDGHDVEYHSTNHLDAEEFVASNGIDRYIAEEIDPDLEKMRALGFDPTTFAYPYGSRTSETDDALLQHFRLLRAIRFTCPY
jgi:peptidoglycan/xylan/chitin deacetylase (PgdA/CDA1 family)